MNRDYSKGGSQAPAMKEKGGSARSFSTIHLGLLGKIWGVWGGVRQKAGPEQVAM